ncbi:MAG: LysR family transcriptional regulator [Clostridiales bacterium]|nr:LysR family transcriptional regulator [Clostridiales bacterium]
MEIRVLRYFLTVAREGGINRAAEILHITQPTLSRQLAALEEEVSVKLFERSARKITLTNEGMLLRRRAEEILALVDRIQMEKDLVDIGILLEPIDIEKFDFLRLNLKERWVALMRPDDPLAARETVSPNDLKGKPLILPARANVRNELSNWLGEDFSESQVLFTSNLATNGALMVQAGLGYSIIIEGAIPFWDDRKIVNRPLSPEIISDSVFAWKRSQPLIPAAGKFIAEIRCFLGITN